MEPSRNCFESSRPPLPTMATTTDSAATRRFAVACGVLSQFVRSGAPSSSFLPPAPPLLPAAEVGNTSAAAPQQQLTIFYGGRVVVLDACPPEKAAELIRLAAAAQVSPVPADPTALVDMPIARKASLRRFLAKRKDRSSSTFVACDRHHDDDDEPEPEPQQQPAAKKGKTVADEASSSSWLALGLGGCTGVDHINGN